MDTEFTGAEFQTDSTRKPDIVKEGIKQKHSVTVKTSPAVVYEFWRDFKNFPHFMKNISKVDVISPIVSHWVIETKNAPNIEWDAQIISDRPSEVIAWQSVGDSPIKQAGSVWFRKAPADLGTVVTLTISYEIPGGKLGEVAAKILGDDPETMILTDLRRFKAYIETGEVPTTQGQPSGRDEIVTH